MLPRLLQYSLIILFSQLFCIGLSTAKPGTITSIKGLDLELIEINVETKLLTGQADVGRVERQFPTMNGETPLIDPRETYANLQKLHQESLAISSASKDERTLQEQLFRRRALGQMIQELANNYELKAQGVLDGVNGFLQRRLPKMDVETLKQAEAKVAAATAAASAASGALSPEIKNEKNTWISQSRFTLNENEILVIEFRKDGNKTNKNLYFHTFANSPMKIGFSWDHASTDSKLTLNGLKNPFLRQHMIATCREVHAYYTYAFTDTPIHGLDPEIRLICELPAKQGYIKFRVHMSEMRSPTVGKPTGTEG